MKRNALGCGNLAKHLDCNTVVAYIVITMMGSDSLDNCGVGYLEWRAT